jgi:hypothetical protein
LAFIALPRKEKKMSGRQLLTLDSRYRTNPEDINGFVYKFKLNKNLKVDGSIRLEQFIFQNSQYVFSEQKGTNKLMIDVSGETFEGQGRDKVITIEGTFDTVDAFVKRFNEIMIAELLQIRMIYTAYLYEFRILHTDGLSFKLNGQGFLDLIGMSPGQNQSSYTNTKVPKLFSQTMIYISLPEFGTYPTVTKDSRGYTFLVLSKPGFEIISNSQQMYSEFYVGSKELDELTVQIRGEDGKAFTNNKGNANFIIVLSY